MKKATAAMFALCTGIMASQAYAADPLLEALAQKANASNIAVAKIENFCSRFNTVVAPALKETGISKDFHGTMMTFKLDKTQYTQCVIYSGDKHTMDSSVAAYGDTDSEWNLNSASINNTIADGILRSLTPQDRIKLAEQLPDLLHP